MITWAIAWMTVRLKVDTLRSFVKLKPPPRGPFIGLLQGVTFDDVVELLQRWEFRKKAFVEACSHMGARLAERMEDKEGWHDMSRAERLKDWGNEEVTA